MTECAMAPGTGARLGNRMRAARRHPRRTHRSAEGGCCQGNVSASPSTRDDASARASTSTTRPAAEKAAASPARRAAPRRGARAANVRGRCRDAQNSSHRGSGNGVRAAAPTTAFIRCRGFRSDRSSRCRASDARPHCCARSERNLGWPGAGRDARRKDRRPRAFPGQFPRVAACALLAPRGLS
jgi:hypothetical protein